MVTELFSGSVVLPSTDDGGTLVATVKLVDRDGEVLAASAIEATSSPIPFELAVDPELRDGSRTSIWAYVRSEHGAWGTLELVPVRAGADTVEVPVSRLDS